ncbi:MAG: hypothetical protein AB7G23_02575 [Vicinamibacterales bacterium]
MAKVERAVLESALRARRLDRTLTATHLTGPGREAQGGRVPTGVAALDRLLHGGLPGGALSELAGSRSSGCTMLLLQVLAETTRRGGLAALVDTCDRLDLSSAVEAGIELDRLLWIRGQPITRTAALTDAHGTPGGPGAARAPGLLERAIDRGVKACALVLQAGGFGVVALDLSDVAPAALGRLPFTTWLRLQRLLEGSETAGLLVAPAPLARSADGVSLVLQGQASWRDGTGPQQLVGLETTIRIVSPRRTVQGEVALRAQFDRRP